MKMIEALKNSAAVIGLLSVSVLSPAMLNANASTATSQVNQRSHNTGGYEVAATPRTSCAKITTKSYKNDPNYKYVVNVRERPNGPIVGRLDDATSVKIVKRNKNGWVQISGPVQGYVFGGYLTGC